MALSVRPISTSIALQRSVQDILRYSAASATNLAQPNTMKKYSDHVTDLTRSTDSTQSTFLTHLTLLTYLTFLAFLALTCGCQALTYAGPDGERFSRRSLGVTTSISALVIETGSNG